MEVEAGPSFRPYNKMKAQFLKVHSSCMAAAFETSALAIHVLSRKLHTWKIPIRVEH